MRINRIKRLLCLVMTVFIMLSVIPNVLASEAQSAKSLDNKEVESEVDRTFTFSRNNRE